MKLTRHILRGFTEHCCMYRYPAALPPEPAPPVVDDLSWLMLDQQSISSHFIGEPRHLRLFQGFLAGGSLGVCLRVGAEWAAYAWMATPGHARPPHIPPGVAPEAFWIYFCSTKYGFGGKGLYKFAQRLLLNAAYSVTPKAEVLIDTTPDNLLSRRAIISTGFAPAGMLHCTYLWLPRIMRRPLSCRWLRDAAHPALPEGHRG